MNHRLTIATTSFNLFVCCNCMIAAPPTDSSLDRSSPTEKKDLASESHQPDRLALQFRRAAQAIIIKLAELDVKACTFGNIAPKSGNSEFGKQFIPQVELQLRNLTVDVDPNAPIVISGSFLVVVPDEDQPEVVFLLNFDKPNEIKPVSSLDVKIVFFTDSPGTEAGAPATAQSDTTDQQAEAALFAAGITTTCKPNSTLPNRRKEIAQLVRESKDRTQVVEMTYVGPDGRTVTEPAARVDGGMGYAMQIRSQEGSLPHSVIRAQLNDHPIGFVPLQKDMKYVVRLINPLPFDAVARLEIDGVSVFRYATESPAPEFFLIPAGSSIDIPGWMNNTEASRRFQIVTFEDSARAKEGLAPPGDGLGVISVSFRYAWIQDPPNDEGSARSGTQGTGELPPLTGLGPVIEQKYETVSRRIGFQSDVIHLRYGKTEEATKKANAAVVKTLQPQGGAPQ